VNASRADPAADAAVERLRQTAVAFGAPRDEAPALRYAGLVEAGGDLAPAIELVYEGYLLHYRESRALADGPSPETLLLAGDYFYAHGLRLVAQGGDVEAVSLLSRLMAACSYLRVEGAPFSWDDDLWELTARAVGDLSGPGRRLAAAAFDDIERAIGTDGGDLRAALAKGLAALREPFQRESARS
jgi:hypothetical protein